MEANYKIDVYCDADDTILKSSEAVVDILNRRFNLNPPKTFEDMKDWNYRSIHPDMTSEAIFEIYESDEFFNIVQVNEVFDRIYKNYSNVFNFYVVTKGRKHNLVQKKKFFEERYPHIGFIGLEFSEREYEANENNRFSKSFIDMRGGIQIDDRVDCLDGSASCKILLTNGIDVPWNRDYENIENLYIAQDWNAIETLLGFIAQNAEFLNSGVTELESF